MGFPFFTGGFPNANNLILPTFSYNGLAKARGRPRGELGTDAKRLFICVNLRSFADDLHLG